MQSFSHLQAFVTVQALKSLLPVGSKYKAVGTYSLPSSKSRPLARSPLSAKQPRQGVCVHPTTLLLQASSHTWCHHPNVCHFPRPSQLSWTGSAAWTVLKSFILSAASILMIFSVIFFREFISRLTSAPHRSVWSILSLP